MDNPGGFAEEYRQDRIGPARVIGIAIIIGLCVFAVSWFLQVAGSTEGSEAGPEIDLGLVDDDDDDDGDGDGDRDGDREGDDDSGLSSVEEPMNLALRVAQSSGAYRVDRLRRDGNDAQSQEAEIDISFETDLFPTYSLAVRPSIGPGLYATEFGVQNCSFELRRLNADGKEAVIGQDRLFEGRMLATVNDVEVDVFDPSWSCGDWLMWSPLETPLETAGSGDYWRNDLLVGNWTVSRGCEWEKVVGFRGADLADVQESGIGPGQLTIDDSTLGLRVRRCPGGLRWRQPLPSPEDSQ